MKIFIGIPARMASSRLPHKPLILIKNDAMIKHVYKRCVYAMKLVNQYMRTKFSKESEFEYDVFIATPDKEIADYCRDHQMNYRMTRPDIKRPCLRVFEAMEDGHYKDDDMVVVVQGDEPCLHSYDIKDMIITYLHHIVESMVCKSALVANAYTKSDYKSAQDPNEIKVVIRSNQYAMYFSRSVIPSKQHNEIEPDYFKQVCVYIFNKKAVWTMLHSEAGIVEQAESIEMIRPLDCGIPVHMYYFTNASQSVDVAADVIKVEKLLNKDPIYLQLIKEGELTR